MIMKIPIQENGASLVDQMVKDPPAMQETWVRSLGWEDPLEEGMATHSSVLAWRISMDRVLWSLERGLGIGLQAMQEKKALISR